MRRALVTGASGFVGAAVCRRLVRDGVEVVGLARRRREAWPPLRVVDGCYLVHGDVTDLHFVSRTLAEYEPDVIFHLAGEAPGSGDDAPLRVFELQTRSSWVLLDAVRRTRSSQRVVLVGDGRVHRDGQPVRGAGPNATAHACADLIARCYFDTYRLPVTVVRTHLIFGPGDLRWERLVPGTLKAVLSRLPLPATHEQGLRPIALDDAVAGILRAAETPESSVELVGAVALDGVDLQRRVASLASDAAPVPPSATAFDRALRLTVDWYRDHLAEKSA